MILLHSMSKDGQYGRLGFSHNVLYMRKETKFLMEAWAMHGRVLWLKFIEWEGGENFRRRHL